MNKKLFLLPIMAIVLILGGCSNSNRIDTSSLVQTITAENKSGKAVKKEDASVLAKADTDLSHDFTFLRSNISLKS